MRVFFGKDLQGLVEGIEDVLNVAGQLSVEISGDLALGLEELPREIVGLFNEANPHGVDFVSPVTVYVPDEFLFQIDVEGLDRLSRETLIRLAPMGARVWQAGHVAIDQLRLGKGEPLPKEDREELFRATKQVREIPIRNKSFLLGQDITGVRRVGLEEAIRQAGGLVFTTSIDRGDYGVTDDVEEGHLLEARVSRVLDSVTLAAMLDRE